jgi:hypothetical protein
MSSQNISTYHVKNSDKITYIPISQIEFDSMMIKKLNEINNDKKYKKYHQNNFGTLLIKDRGETFHLQRIDRIIDGIEKETELPPVDLKIHESYITESVVKSKYIPPHLRGKISPSEIIITKMKSEPKISYSVDNGRHRVVASLFLGLTHIPAVISK